MQQPKSQEKRFIGTFVNEMYAILLGIGIGNVIFSQNVDLGSVFDIVMALFVTSVVLLYWWDWTEFVSKRVASSKREFAIDFLILITLEFLFGRFNSPVRLAPIFLVLGCLDLLWVGNYLYQFREQYRSRGKRWILEKVLAIVIYALCYVTIYFTRNLAPIWILGGIMILGFALVRNVGFSQVKMISSLGALLRMLAGGFRFREALPGDAAAIAEINNSNLLVDSQKGFFIVELDAAEVERSIKEGPERYYVAQNRDSCVVGFVETSDSVSQEVINEMTWFDLELQGQFHPETAIYIEKVAARQDHRRQGIGRFLYESLFRSYTSTVFYAFVVLSPVTNYPPLEFHLGLKFSKAAVSRALEFCGLSNYQSSLLLIRS
ncbi:MAG: GNAT family N-acetyltransferase [Anaerolineae bacterium]|jgi:ribosomal protein S18 acetylase RimI-like enzyme